MENAVQDRAGGEGFLYRRSKQSPREELIRLSEWSSALSLPPSRRGEKRRSTVRLFPPASGIDRALNWHDRFLKRALGGEIPVPGSIETKELPGN